MTASCEQQDVYYMYVLYIVACAVSCRAGPCQVCERQQGLAAASDGLRCVHYWVCCYGSCCVLLTV